MEIKLNLLEEFDSYTLFIFLGNEISRLKKDNHEHEYMINLLEGNENNELAKNKLSHEKDCIKNNNEKIKILDNVREQLRPLIDKLLSPTA